MWQCVGFPSIRSRRALIGRGKTPAQAYSDWQEVCNFPF
jgi:hypothetical protein